VIFPRVPATLPTSKVLLEPAAHPNVLGGKPENGRECEAGISPVPHQCLGPARLADRGFSRSYEISYRGLKLPRISAVLGRCHMRSGADFPQVGHSNPMGF
jgi:hypothetical protein